VSRKSFLGAVTGADVQGRGAATLAAELWAARAGAAWIRTHDVRALRDALLVERAIAEQP
jgi:dihydropteroate synthase